MTIKEYCTEGGVTESLPGDIVEFFTVHLNHQRTDFIADDSETAVNMVLRAMDFPQGKLKMLKEDKEARIGDRTITGTIAGLTLDVILEEWRMGDNGAAEAEGMLPPMKIH